MLYLILLPFSLFYFVKKCNILFMFLYANLCMLHILKYNLILSHLCFRENWHFFFVLNMQLGSLFLFVFLIDADLSFELDPVRCGMRRGSVDKCGLILSSSRFPFS